MTQLAILAPALPGISTTFVHREIEALEAAGQQVQRYSLRTGDDQSDEGKEHASATSVLYAAPLRLLFDALAAVATQPILAGRAMAWALSDFFTGAFDRAGQRLRVPIQLVAGLALAWRLRASGASHLRIHFAHAPATVGMYAAAAASIPFSIVGHARDLLVEGGLLERKLRRASLFTTISDANRAELNRRFGELASRVGLERCGVDRQAFAGGPRRLVDQPPVVGTVARLVPKKGLDQLLRAFRHVRRHIPSARLTVIGEGPERHALEQLRAQLDLDLCVDLVGAQDGKTVRRLLKHSDVFCLPCRVSADGDRDGIPVALMEAMASGVPVVAGAVPGIDELIEHDVNGVLVNAEDAGQLGRAIVALLSSPTRRSELATRASATIARHFDIGRNAELILERIEAATGRALTGPLFS